MQLFLRSVAILFTLPVSLAMAKPLHFEEDVSAALETNAQATVRDDQQSAKPLMTEAEIRACIDNTYELEEIIRLRASTASVMDGYLTDSLKSHKINKERIIDVIDMFTSDCELLGKNCRSLEIQKRRLQEETQRERETKKEVVEYINKAISYKKAEAQLRASFDVNCEYRPYDKALVHKLCRESFASDDPICRHR